MILYSNTLMKDYYEDFNYYFWTTNTIITDEGEIELQYCYEIEEEYLTEADNEIQCKCYLASPKNVKLIVDK